MSKFVLDQTTTVHFTTEQLMAIAVDVLVEEGHDFSEDTIKPTLNNKGLTLAISKTTGKPAPKKRAPRKPRSDKGTSVAEPTETPKEVEPAKEELTMSQTGLRDKAEDVAKDNKNPYAPTSPDADVAKIREDNGVAPVANFPSDAEVPEGTAPAVSFDDL